MIQGFCAPAKHGSGRAPAHLAPQFDTYLIEWRLESRMIKQVLLDGEYPGYSRLLLLNDPHTYPRLDNGICIKLYLRTLLTVAIKLWSMMLRCPELEVRITIYGEPSSNNVVAQSSK